MSEAADEKRERRRKVSHVGAPAIFKLQLACQQVNDAFGGFGCYLVGSSIDRPDWRDVDVRFIMTDEEFQAEFPGTFDPDREVGTWEFDPKWILVTAGIAAFLANASGLPIDFQFQPQTHANTRHQGTRHPLGIKFAEDKEEAT